jgi:acyl-CoA synthetase (AMP-forming)/AMP-acid ligase II
MVASGEESEEDETDSTTKAAPFGTPGEILIRSPALMSAYLPTQGLHSSEKPDMSVTMEHLTPDGWLRTGDIGTLDPDGTLCITDRIKELIKVRAYQVAPAELEAILCSSDAVADAGVVGVHDANEATEWPRAYVVAADQTKSEADLKILAQELKSIVESHAARYKWLVGGIVFVKQIPKSPSGKILRRVIRDGGVQGLEVALYQRKKRDHKL